MNEEKQIEELARVINSLLGGLGCGNFNFTGEEFSVMVAENLYMQGCRKQKEGEWKKRVTGNGWNCWSEFTCSLCGASFEDESSEIPTNYCPNCGAKMKG